VSRLVGSDRGLREVEHGGRTHRRQKDGTFHVDPVTAKQLVRTGDFAVAGTNFARARGFVCQDCGFNALLADHCGRCNGSNLVAEEDA